VKRPGECAKVRADRAARAKLAELVAMARGATTTANDFVDYFVALIVKSEGEPAEARRGEIVAYAKAVYAGGTSRKDRRRNAAIARSNRGR
jgi:hypothetical protein